MGAHCATEQRPARDLNSYPYQARHVDVDRQPGHRYDLPDDWFDPGIDRSPTDADVGAR